MTDVFPLLVQVTLSIMMHDPITSDQELHKQLAFRTY